MKCGIKVYLRTQKIPLTFLQYIPGLRDGFSLKSVSSVCSCHQPQNYQHCTLHALL
jgi:hypothetical protein